MIKISTWYYDGKERGYISAWSPYLIQIRFKKEREREREKERENRDDGAFRSKTREVGGLD